jgi:signal transduction histidine kinase
VRIRWSVRARTTTAAVGVLLPVLALAGTAGVLFQRDDLTSGVSALAEDQARGLARDVAEGSVPSSLGGEEEVVQVVSTADGSIVASSPGADREALLPTPSGSTPVHTQVTGAISGESDRYAAVALRAGDGASYVIVGRSLESVDAATASTTGLFLVGGLLVILTVASLTWLATGRALSPVEAMRRRAASISADQLGSRLPVPASDDEVARLATTLNDLLERIDVANRTQLRFVADASHELRSPVATIRALLESDQIAAHPGGHEGLSSEVLDETSRLAALVDDLLILARGDARLPSEHQLVDLSTLLRREVRRPRRVPVSAAVPAGLTVSGDPDSLAGAVRNLLDNAERFAIQRISVAASRAGDEVRLEVVDDGPGVPPMDQERVFERFVRLDGGRSRAEGGTGLGLAIVQQVVHEHGGSIRVDSATPGALPPGARFIVTLPSA